VLSVAARGLGRLNDLPFTDGQVKDDVATSATQRLLIPFDRRDVQKLQAAFFGALHGFEKRMECSRYGGKFLRLKICPLVIMNRFVDHPFIGFPRHLRYGRYLPVQGGRDGGVRGGRRGMADTPRTRAVF
jgi:hypothetical protein